MFWFFFNLLSELTLFRPSVLQIHVAMETISYWLVHYYRLVISLKCWRQISFLWPIRIRNSASSRLHPFSLHCSRLPAIIKKVLNALFMFFFFFTFTSCPQALWREFTETWPDASCNPVLMELLSYSRTGTSPGLFWKDTRKWFACLPAGTEIRGDKRVHHGCHI